MATYRGWQGRLERHVSWGGGTSNTSYAVAQVEGWSIDVDNSAEAHFAVGSRTATDVSVGPKNVTGSINRVWFQNVYAQSYINTNQKPHSWNFYGWTKYGEGKSVIARNCFVSTWAGSGENEGYATEDLDFIAQGIET